jgi:ribosome assembly protein YihI (activator of Der GTPase)
VLADGEFIITPQSAAEYASTRRGTRPRVVSVQTASSPSTAEWDAYRAAARELAKTAVAERMNAATARDAAAAERQNAQATRERALQEPDATARADIRQTVEEHVEAARRYAEEAAEHAAAAAMARTALIEQKALLQRMLDAPTAPRDAH